MVHLGQNRYGKSGIRLITITREDWRHVISDFTVDVWLYGDFHAAYVDADNASVLPTDTLRGTVYALAREHPTVVMEDFAVRLAGHFHVQVPHADRAEVSIAAGQWDRIGGDHDHAFTRGPQARTLVTASMTDTGPHVEGGIEDLVVLKSTRSGFSGFMVDEYTTLAETDDRILATSIAARWGLRQEALRDGDVDWTVLAGRTRQTLLETFADHDSKSVQHTLYAMGEAVLRVCGELTWIRLSMPNLHHVLVDLSPYGKDNPNQVFAATDRPFGAIEATVVAGEASGT